MSARPLPAIAFTTEPAPVDGRPAQEISWPQIMVAAPQMAATMARYLDQLAVSARPATVLAVDLTLRQFAGCVTATDPTCQTMAQVTRGHFEEYKAWLAARPGRRGALSPTTISGRLGLLRTFFERIIEWGYHDAPARVPIYTGDFPNRDLPLPKFLDDPTAARFMAALATDPNQRRRLMVEILARTGIRSGELSGLEDDAMTLIGDIHWLRIPVGKLHNDRYVPLVPTLVRLIHSHLATRPPARSGRLVERDDGQPFDRRTIHRYVAAVAKRAGVGPVHPHQFRHTLATQAINRGMSLEAIAALLGHRSMTMTLTYARIADRTIADEYFRVTTAVEATYQPGAPPHADTAGPIMTGLAADHRRHLGNGHCNRPAALDCIHESICERCGFFETGPTFVPVLIRQRDHATDHDQHQRAQLFTNLLDKLDTTT
jgi:integrase